MSASFYVNNQVKEHNLNNEKHTHTELDAHIHTHTYTFLLPGEMCTYPHLQYTHIFVLHWKMKTLSAVKRFPQRLTAALCSSVNDC